MTPLRILMVEDSEDDFLLLREELRGAGFDVTAQRVDTAEQMQEALTTSKWDLVLSDFSMPQFDGMSALQTLHDSDQKETPFIIVSGSIGEIRAVEALKAGAANYVMKENLEKLVPVVKRELKDAAVRRERREAFDALRTAVSARDDFLAIASHELKTPLTSLMLHVQSVQRTLQSPEERKEVTLDLLRARTESVARSSKRLSVLIDRLLDITRVTTNEQLALNREEVDLTGLLQHLVAQVQEGGQPKGSTLSVRAPDALRGRWDPERLEAVVSNLLQNAIKYGEGKPIDLEAEDLGDSVRLRVTDRGMGIAPDDQQRIFRRFERAVSDRHFGGFGVGLWLVRRIVDAHGGNISVASAPGTGATFTVHLPKDAPPAQVQTT